MTQPELQTKGLVKRFGANTILDGIDFSLAKGEVAVILGPSGCGKSTFLRCLIGLETIDAGEVLLKGKPVTYAGTLRNGLGMVFQSYDLFPHLTVLENVTLAPVQVAGKTKVEAQKTAETLLKRVGLWEKRDFYPRELSGGQKQRVAIVRALAMNPSPEFLAGHFVHFHNPYFDILHSRIGIAEFLIRILFHNDIQSFRFFIEIFFKVDFTPANHALGAHPVTTSDLRMLENEIMVRAKCNADTRIPFQNGNTPSFLCRMQVYNTITIAKVHRQYIGSPIRIGQSHITDITLLNGRFNQFFVGMY